MGIFDDEADRAAHNEDVMEFWEPILVSIMDLPEAVLKEIAGMGSRMHPVELGRRMNGRHGLEWSPSGGHDTIVGRALYMHSLEKLDLDDDRFRTRRYLH